MKEGGDFKVNLVAIDDDHRRAYVGFEPANEDDVPDWLILMTNIVDHFAATPHTTSQPRRLGEGWRQLEPSTPLPGAPGTRYGVYQRGEALVAINVSAPVLRQCETGNLRASLLEHADAQSRMDMARWLWLGAAVLAAAAITTIKPHR